MEYKYLDATPCPVTWDRKNDGKIPIFEDILDSYDDTTEMDIMAELGSLNSLAREKPRRAKKATEFKIHEDSGDSGNGHGGRMPLSRESSMFSQPAQRLPRPVRATFRGNLPPKPSVKKQLGQSKENYLEESSTLVRSPHAMQKPVKERKLEKKDTLKIDKRRNTIYIPPDDTTMATIFMDAFSPLTTKDFGVPEMGYIEAQIVKKRKQRRLKSPTPQEKRQPLESPSRVIQESTQKLDIMGMNTGKENVPPGKLVHSNVDIVEKKNDLVEAPTQPMKAKSVNSPRPRLSMPQQKLSSSKASTSRALRGQGSIQRTTSTGNQSIRASPIAKQREETMKEKNESLPLNASLLKPVPKKKLPSELLLSIPLATKVDIKYPALGKNIADPLIYEENWLSHQEMIITRLVNTVLDANGPSNTQSQYSLRDQLFHLYQDTYFTLLYKRVQASILYGDLRATEGPDGRSRRLTTDVGMRRAFQRFWTDTYDISALQAAAEVVIGKGMGYCIHDRDRSSAPQTSPCKGEKRVRRAVESYLDAMLIKNEDMNPIASTEASDCGCDVVKGYHRTALRSIMIIALLDRARMDPDTALPRRLFKASSAYTSSAAVMRALGPLLHHPQADFNRPLSRLDCLMKYKQHPLAEYNYHIENIAVDIRDGVILARLTELLLLEQFPNKFQASEGEIWVMSHQLKMPCINRATKIHNARISLSALEKDLPSIGAFISGIKPEDIVDGYREKTIALLWVIVSKWGLSCLVDWDDLKNEITRLEKKGGRLDRKRNNRSFHERVDTTDMTAYHSSLLHHWASCLARLKGLEVPNLTTSLADGRVFTSILDEYEYFIRPASIKAERAASPTPLSTTITTTTGDESALKRRLLSLGCSSPFVALISPRPTSPSSTQSPSLSGNALSKDFNIIALAYLSSRLLSASKYGRAAVSIQRAWRHTLATRPVIDGSTKGLGV
ncbi:hypothetical protein MauCBS54593_007424 [Microsporum audouinii]